MPLSDPLIDEIHAIRDAGQVQAGGISEEAP
jgi:hypothetical protein